MPVPKRSPANLRVAIRGRGRAGRALERALREAGIPVSWIPRSRPRPAAYDFVVLAVPDDAVAAESARLIRAGIRARAAMHLSGALPAAVLRGWKRTGTALVSFHPLGSFSGARTDTAGGRDVAVEGDAAGIAAAERLARTIGGRPWRIAAAEKPLYHAAATAAAGGTATIVALAALAARRAGMPAGRVIAAMARLSREAAENVAARGFPAGLTGPLARGDAGTLRLHRRALARDPRLAEVYRALAKAAAEKAGRGGPPRG